MARPRLHYDHHQMLLTKQQEDLMLARKDAISAFGVWCLLEVLSFIVLPNFQIIKGANQLGLWLSITVPLGIIGAGLIGWSSWLVKHLQEKMDRSVTNKQLYVTLSQALGWVGLVGIGLPIIAVGLELWLLMWTGPL